MNRRGPRDFDRRLWRRFWNIAKRYWTGDERWKAFGLLLLLVALLLGRTELVVLFNEQSGELTSALAARDAARFWRSMRVFGVALAVAVPIYAVYYYVRDTLGMAWRRWLTGAFVQQYLENLAFYRLTFEKHIDNPDQRIAEDVGAFTQKSLKLLVEIVGAVLQLLAFSGILWAISHTLVWFLVGYAALGTLVTFGIFGKPLIELNFQQLRREADFRFGLIRARENAEAIAFYRGEGLESDKIGQRFQALFVNFNALLRRTLGLNLFQYAYTFATYVMPSIILAPRILSGELEVGRVVQAAGAFASMLGALTVFVDQFELLSGFAAGIDRLHTFGRALSKGAHDPRHLGEQIVTVTAPRIQLRHVTLLTPDRRQTLIRDLSLRVEPGAGLLIIGPSGCGKSSLLRAVAGLWQSGTGIILRPGFEQMLFLPQRPYMVLGSLREQLLYPGPVTSISDAELCEVLERVNLPLLVERCGGFDAELDFGKLLSIGEQQRLAIARVLLRRPSYVILDEATSALDSENERRLYELLRRTQATLLSVAHRRDLVRFHGQVLELTSDGSWRLNPSPCD
jgi:vitamin B12/bleomycin/antimicrobial peptide transport system ATP-binding/permease protein